MDENISEPSPDEFDLPGDERFERREPAPLGPDATEDEWWSTTAALLFEPDQLVAQADGQFATDLADQPIAGQLDFMESAADPVHIEVEQTTEWFTFDDDAEPEPLLPRRFHHVTAVVVTHNGGTWLPSVMSRLASQTRPADGAVGVDTGSTDDSAAVLRATLGLDRVITTANEGFGHAVRTGLERVGRIEVQEGDEFAELITWVWLLHDDSAPDAGCLEALLNTADDNPSASILGPKILGWHDRRLLLEVGVSITGAGRRYTGLERGEHDQGQHDGVRDVMSVSSAGMLVRRDVWELLQGFDPQVPFFRDDLDFCWRAHRAGERVIIATNAVLHHREASAHGRRTRSGSDEAEQRPHRLDREAAVHVLLAQSGRVAGIFVALRLLLGSAFQALAYVLGKDFKSARDEIGAVLDVALHPGRLVFSRELNRNTADEPISIVRSLRPTTASQLRQVFESVIGIASTSGAATEPTVSAIESGPSDDDAAYLDSGSPGLLRRIFVRPGFMLFAVLALFSLVATRMLWFGDGVLQGGALLPAPLGAGDVWDSYTQAWHNVMTGSSTPSSPYLLIVFAVSAVLLGKAPLAVSVLLLLSIPLAGWSAYFALRGVINTRAIRIWAGIAYGLLPAVTGAISSGRLGTAIAAVTIPFAIRSFVRITSPGGTTRRAAATALLMSMVIAAAPGLWLIALIFALVIVISRWNGVRGLGTDVNRRLLIAVAGPLLILLPWSGYLLTHPALFLLEPGAANIAAGGDPNVSPVQVLMLHPGGPGEVPIWLTFGIVLAGFLAILREEKRRQVLACWILAALAFVLGVVQSLLTVAPPGSAVPLHPWPGPATLVLGLCFIACAAIAVDGLREQMADQSFSIAQPIAVVIAIAAAAAPFMIAVGWFPEAQGQMRRAPGEAVPAFVAADAATPDAPRTLVLTQNSSGGVAYNLINGAGPVLGDADVSPGVEVLSQLDAQVAALSSGRGGDEVGALAGFGVRYVLLSAASTKDIVPVLDAEPGLRRLSNSGGEVLWRISGTTSRARLIAGTEQSTVPLASPASVGISPYIDERIADAPAPRTLLLGATIDGGWRAIATNERTRESVQLEPKVTPGIFSWSQAFEAPAGNPIVTAEFEGGPRAKAMTIQLFVFLVFLVLALPSRRVSDPDPDDLDGPVADPMHESEVSA